MWIELDQTFQRLSHSRPGVTTFTIDTHRFWSFFGSIGYTTNVLHMVRSDRCWLFRHDGVIQQMEDGNRYFQILRECDREFFVTDRAAHVPQQPYPYPVMQLSSFKDPRRNFCCDTGLGVFYDTEPERRESSTLSRFSLIPRSWWFENSKQRKTRHLSFLNAPPRNELHISLTAE